MVSYNLLNHKSNNKMKLKRGDVVQLVYPNESILDRQYRIAAMSPDNHLSDDRADICEVDDTKSFEAKRGVGMPIKYLKKVTMKSQIK